MVKPLLSVALITYNHGPYIRQCLESILAQETDFDFEIVAGEDFSTDNTREILDEFKARFPEKIRLLYREKNLGRPTLNVYQTSMACRGEFIAYIEGDDFWTDVHKLQTQADFLTEHPEYAAVTHSAVLVDEKGEPLSDSSPMELYDWSGRYTFDDYKTVPRWPGHTASVFTRNFWHDGEYDYTILYRAHDFIDDAVILLFMLLHGPVMRLDPVMSAWRYVAKADGENWNSLKAKRDEALEECRMRCIMLKWCEKNVGLTSFGRKKALADMKYALSIFLRHPSGESLNNAWTLFCYDILHVTLHILPFKDDAGYETEAEK
ncbi:MAG: glycosyltransferase [Lachnospiraceae bacterium]|nr:glycosyltransferase [Lachnospiraceae bacterium]